MLFSLSLLRWVAICNLLVTPDQKTNFSNHIYAENNSYPIKSSYSNIVLFKYCPLGNLSYNYFKLSKKNLRTPKNMLPLGPHPTSFPLVFRICPLSSYVICSPPLRRYLQPSLHCRLGVATAFIALPIECGPRLALDCEHGGGTSEGDPCPRARASPWRRWESNADAPASQIGPRLLWQDLPEPCAPASPHAHQSGFFRPAECDWPIRGQYRHCRRL